MKRTPRSTALCGVLAAASLLLVLALPRGARAERAVVFAAGALKPSERAAVAAAAATAVTEAGWSTAAPSLSTKEDRALAECLASDKREGCVGALLEREHVDRGVMLRVAIEGEKKAPTWVVYGWVFRPGGELLALDTRYCESCTSESGAAAARELASALVKAARAETERTVLRVRSTPGSAKVTLDDKPVGVTELELEVYPGTHLVRLERDGYRAETREVSVEDGERALLDVELVPSAGAGDHATGDAKRRSSRWPWAVLGAGTLCLVGGGVLLAIDEDRATSGGVRLPEYRDTALGGAILGGAGLAAIGVSTYLLVTREARSPRPAVAVLPGSAWVGVAGAF